MNKGMIAFFLASGSVLVLTWGCGSTSTRGDSDAGGDGDVAWDGDLSAEDIVEIECGEGAAACGALCVNTSLDHANCGG